MEVSEIIKNINAAVDSLPTEITDEDRIALLAAKDKLQDRIETPLDTFVRFMLSTVQTTALRLGHQMKFLETGIAAHGPVSLEDLAKPSSADPQLVNRIMRVLVAMKFFQEPEKNVYIANPHVAAFMKPSPLAAGIHHIGHIVPTIASLPEYLAKHGYQDPSDAFNGPWQLVNQTKDQYFEWIAKRPEDQEAFNTLMAITRLQRGEDWFEFYPVEDKLKASSPEDIVLVDIGGGLGHDAIAFRNHFPDLPGKVVVEDLPAVTAEIKDLPDGIEALGHSFLDPQPASISNAKAYYLRTVLHDWPDKQALVILKHIRNIMSKDSILLINENAMPDTNVPLYAAQIDFTMMASFSSLDRTEEQFRKLLEEARFSLLKVWRPKVELPGSAVLFEASKKE
ncbi:S-adenosyl-L-methionine-dependent methyltransferase [Lophiotrema nucula]|uniref:S-adenosyl-L-methionine-dependent methyltransferase n=1 Tax=Lophiotrema nucula TaxID=690887 RepID=A0A6A5YN09_9PLEO|nr:S-adenosyl-L-methionine-dependent methyltransferase [Lophiotrema nucula]